MANQDSSQEIVLNAFEAPEHGWRGLGVEGNRKRKWYTVLDNEFVLVGAKRLAAAMERHSKERSEQIRECCRRLWGRTPADAEVEGMSGYAEKHGMANLCRVLINTDEFLFVD